MSKTNPARGMRDFLPADVRKREYVIGVIKEVYESYGFEPLETPAVENIDTLMGKYGDEGNQLIFKILKRGEKLRQETGDERQENDSSGLSSPDSRLADLALRYDLTVPLARVVANHKNDLPKFFKRYQIQPVWRADRPARGRFREFYQCDVDCIGSESMVVEADLISAVSDILSRVGFTNFTVFVNHRNLLSAVLDAIEIPEAVHSETLVALDKLGKIGLEGFEEELGKIGLSTDQIERFCGLMNEIWNMVDDSTRAASAQINLRLLSHVEEFIGEQELGQRAVHDLRRLVELIPKRANLLFDLALARGLSYYTGTIMEINVPDLAGSLGGGGRYDGLIGMFGKEQIPACGFSLGLERILVVMEERGMFPPEIADSTPADVMVTIWSDETVAESLKLANELRAQKLRVTVYPEADKLGKQLKYADSIKVPYVCVLGESEIADGTITLKNMKTGEQQAYPRSEIASKIV